MKPHHADTVLQAAVGDFIYLVNQVAAFVIWEWKIKDSLPTHVRKAQYICVMENAAVESSLLTARVLNDFFKPAERLKKNGRRFETDIQAHDFGFPTKTFLEDNEATGLNQRLAHFSTERAKSRGDEWHIEIIKNALVRCLDFLEYLIKGDRKFLLPGVNLDESITACHIFIRRIDSLVAAYAAKR